RPLLFPRPAPYVRAGLSLLAWPSCRCATPRRTAATGCSGSGCTGPPPRRPTSATRSARRATSSASSTAPATPSHAPAPPRGGTAAGALVGRGRARSSRIEHPRARGLCTRTDAVQIAARAGDPPLAGLLLLPAWHEADRCDHQAVQAR